MNALYLNLSSKNVKGLPYEEALQLFLWIFCTLDILPDSLKSEEIDREILVKTFSRLEREGAILPPSKDAGRRFEESFETLTWEQAIDALLNETVGLDLSFPERASRYFQK